MGAKVGGGDSDAAFGDINVTPLVDVVLAPYTWSGSGMVDDLNDWLSGAAPEHGWLLIGNEADNGTARRLASRDSPLPAIRPRLTITYHVACAADLDGSGSVDFTDLVSLLASWGPCSGCAADLNHDGVIGFADLLIVLNDWGPCP